VKEEDCHFACIEFVQTHADARDTPRAQFSDKALDDSVKCILSCRFSSIKHPTPPAAQTCTYKRRSEKAGETLNYNLESMGNHADDWNKTNYHDLQRSYAKLLALQQLRAGADGDGGGGSTPSRRPD